MMHFTVDAFQPTSTPVDNCQKCCCDSLSLRPGTINRMVVGYAPWALPIGRLHCEPSFTVEQMDTCPPSISGNLPPALVAEKAIFSTALNAPLTNTLTTQITDPEGAELTFKPLMLYGPRHGRLLLQPNGDFDFTPAPNYKGQDRFFASASDGVNTLVFEVLLSIGGFAIESLVSTPIVGVDPNGVQVDERYYTVSFPISVSPAARECEVWRLTVLQGALDCACVCYARTDCFDIRIVKC